MKKLIFIGLALILFTACKKTAPQTEEIIEVVEIETISNLDVINGIYASFAAGDIESFLGALDAEVVWMEAEGFPYADNNPYIGPEAVLNGVLARVGADWDGFTIVEVQLHDMANDMVLATNRYHGTNKKTGKTLNAQAAHLWTLKDGKIVKFQQYIDTKHVAEVIAE